MEDEFNDKVRESLAETIGYNESDIVIEGLRKGSVIVVFTVDSTGETDEVVKQVKQSIETKGVKVTFEDESGNVITIETKEVTHVEASADSSENDEGRKNAIAIGCGIGIPAGILLLILVTLYIYKKRQRKAGGDLAMDRLYGGYTTFTAKHASDNTGFKASNSGMTEREIP